MGDKQDDDQPTTVTTVWGNFVGRGKSWRTNNASSRAKLDKDTLGEKDEKEEQGKGFFVRKSSTRRSKRVGKVVVVEDKARAFPDLDDGRECCKTPDSVRDLDAAPPSNALLSERRRTLQDAVDKERKSYERKCKEYVQRPSAKKEEKLRESEKRLEHLERKLEECAKEEAEHAREKKGSQDLLHKLRLGAASPTPSSDSYFNVIPWVDEPSKTKSRKLASPNPSHKPPSGMSTSPMPKRGRSMKTEPRAVPSRCAGSPPATTTSPTPPLPTVVNTPASDDNDTASNPASPEKKVEAAPSKEDTTSVPSQLPATPPEKVAPPSTPVAQSSDSVPTAKTTPFSSLDKLSKCPGPLALFIFHLLQVDEEEEYTPQSNEISCLCFYLMSGVLQRMPQQSSYKEIRRMAQEIANLFVVQSSPLPVPLEKSIQDNITDQLASEKKLPEDALRNLYVVARFTIQKSIEEALSSYEKEHAEKDSSDCGLKEDMPEAEEGAIVHTLLDAYVSGKSDGTPVDCAISQVLASVFEELGLDLQYSEQQVLAMEGIGGKPYDSLRSDSSSQRSQTQGSLTTFLTKRTRHQVHLIAGHPFVATHYNTPTFCDVCTGLLWGLGYQGYTCQTCGFNVHKQTCNQNLTIMCTGQQFDRTSNTSLFGDRQRTLRNKAHATRSGHSIHTDITSVSSEGQVSSSGSTLTIDSERARMQTVCTGGRVLSKKTEVFEAAAAAALHRQTSTLSRISRVSVESIGGQRVVVNRRIKSSSAASTKLSRVQSLRDEAARERPGCARVRSATNLEEILNEEPKVMTRYEVQRGNQEQEDLNDSDVEVEEELIPWSFITDKTFVSTLPKKDLKRQDLINELIHTERTHVKKLKVMHYVFYQPLLNRPDLVHPQVVESLFPKLDQLIHVHTKLLSALRSRPLLDRHNYVSYIGDVILDAFRNEEGERMKTAAAIWVQNRQDNVERLRQLAAKSQRFEQFIKVTFLRVSCIFCFCLFALCTAI